MLVPFVVTGCLAIPLIIRVELLLQAIVAVTWLFGMIVGVTHVYLNMGIRRIKPVALIVVAWLINTVGVFGFDFIFRIVKSSETFKELSFMGSTTFSVMVAYVLLASVIYFLSKAIYEVAPVDETSAAEVQISSTVFALSKANGLTKREEEIFGLLARGYSRPYISEKLSLSLSTVKTHANHLYAKLGITKHDDLLQMVYKEAKKTQGQQTHYPNP